MRSTRVAWGMVLGFVAPAVGAAQTVRPMFGLGIGLAVANGEYHSDVNGDGFDTGVGGIDAPRVQAAQDPGLLQGHGELQ